MVHGISCCICLEGGKDGWGHLPCGHVMHYECLLRIFEGRNTSRNPRCPLCNMKIRAKQVKKLFFSEPCEEDLQLVELDNKDAVARDIILNLKARISELENGTKNLKEMLKSEEEHRDRLENHARCLSDKLQSAQEELGAKVKSLRRERDEYLHNAKALENQLSNTKIELERERAYAARQLVALDLDLTGEALIRKLKNTGNSKEWVYEILESRNKKIGSLLSKIEKLEKENNLLQISAKDSENKRREKTLLRQIENTPPESYKQGKVNASIWDADIDGLGKSQGEKRRKSEPLRGSAEEIVILDDSDDATQHSDAPLKVQKGQSSKMLSRAGPSKMAMRAAPGPSFIHKSDLATTGLDDTSTFIKRVPDGKGGWKQVYRNQPLQQSGFKRTKLASSNKTIATFFRK